MAEVTRFWTGERVRLRGVEPEDWEQLAAFELEAETQRNGERLMLPISAAAARKRIQDQSEKGPSRTEDEYFLIIEALDSGDLVGAIVLNDCDRLNGNFHYGIHLGAAYQRRGYASEAMRLVLSFMFGERRYHRCYAEVYAGNAGSLALQHKLGFTAEGVQREHVFQAGGYRDIHRFGLLASEFEKHEKAAGRDPYFVTA
ncbi:GNAT family N-acetyltransferase [Streptomyces sp. NBC_00669]|uniref:GNAT family N-acetyltransferase n=1 Tax=unclassified Streptomyces TaxID=2593676 RepID=UPI002E2F33C2|nr:GNAT family protein [Streptomyces sp. NBC_00669]